MESKSYFTLGPGRRIPLPGCPGFYVRVGQDIRKTVVFFGFKDASPGAGGILCVGTGFLLSYDSASYLVTARHLADDLKDEPFLIRLNKKDGTSDNVPADNVKWVRHPDPNVDVAVVPFALGKSSPYDALYIQGTMLAGDGLVYHPTIETIGLADLTYTIGLFRLMSGEKRSLPIVHSGSIAMMPRDERIPCKDWRPPHERIFMEGYLVETHSLDGLSGSPVFVRPTAGFSLVPLDWFPPDAKPPALASGLAPRQDIRLLGLWQGAWDAPPDDVLAITAGRNVRVSVGVGVVVPAQKIIETLEQKDLKDMRQAEMARRAQNENGLAKPESVPLANIGGVTSPQAKAAAEENPQHREDFNRLVKVAARKRPQGDQT